MLAQRRLRLPFAVLAVLTFTSSPVSAQAEMPEKSRIEIALANITTLVRPGQDGYATVWDGNKYVQCVRRPDRMLRCEAAGTLMQPSLAHVLVPERIARISELGWGFDPSFGNYVQVFPADISLSRVAERILEILVEGYDANLADLGVKTNWVASDPCPPRNGPSQNLAGAVNDAPSMMPTAVHDCLYEPSPDDAPMREVDTAADLIDIYGARVAAELQRLRVNIDRWGFFVIDSGAGYVQCGSESSPPAIYCEAQSADSWPVLSRILTPDRVARLHAAGFSDPGLAPNYWKEYPVANLSDDAIAEELLAVLFDAYGYNGVPPLTFVADE
jgi:hypothetical protein